MEGFADPIYGGNRDKIGWKWLVPRCRRGVQRFTDKHNVPYNADRVDRGSATHGRSRRADHPQRPAGEERLRRPYGNQAQTRRRGWVGTGLTSAILAKELAEGSRPQGRRDERGEMRDTCRF
jgi:hypothetical protein